MLNRAQARLFRNARRVAAWLISLAMFGCDGIKSCHSSDESVKLPMAPPPPAAEVQVIAHGFTDRKTLAARKAARRKQHPVVIKNSGSAWRALTFFVPDFLDGGYRARSVTEGHDVSLGADMGLISVKRAYGKDNFTLELELIDASRCERVRDVFNRSLSVQRESELAVIRPMRVQGRKALSQWLDSTKTARTSVLVADRFLVNANVKPADSPEPSIAVMQKLDWAALEQFASAPTPIPLEPATQIVDSALAAPAVQGAQAVPTDEPTTPANGDAPDSSLLASQPQ